MDPIFLSCVILLVLGLAVSCFTLAVIIIARNILRYPVIIMSILSIYITFLVTLFFFDLFTLLEFSVISLKFMAFMVVVLPLIYPLVALSALRTVLTSPPKSPDRRPLFALVFVVWTASALIAILAPNHADFMMLHHILNGVCFFIAFALFAYAVYQVRALNSVRPALFNFSSACVLIFFLCWCVELANIQWLTLIAIHVTFVFIAILSLLLLLRASAAASVSSGPSKMPWIDWPLVKKSTRPKEKLSQVQIPSVSSDTGSQV